MKLQFEEQDIKELISDHLMKIIKPAAAPEITTCIDDDIIWFEVNIKLKDI